MQRKVSSGEGKKKASDSGPSLTELWKRWAAGDRAAGDIIFERFYPELIRLARRSSPRYLKPRFDTEDILQEAWVTVCRKGPDFAEGGTEVLKSRIRSILVRQGRKDVRRERAKRRDVGKENRLVSLEEIQGRGDSPTVQLVLREEVEIVQRAVAALPRHYREIFEARTIEEKSWDDLAAQYGKSKEALQMLYQRAVRKLRSLLERSFPGKEES